jgi:hypothetical protein
MYKGFYTEVAEELVSVGRKICYKICSNMHKSIFRSEKHL